MTLNNHPEILDVLVVVTDARGLERSIFWIWDAGMQSSPMINMILINMS